MSELSGTRSQEGKKKPDLEARDDKNKEKTKQNEIKKAKAVHRIFCF